MSAFHSVWTVVLLLAFIAIVAWAFSTRRREHFDRAARSVLQDDSPPPPTRGNGANQGNGANKDG